MSNARLPAGKTLEREQRVFTFRVTQLTQLIWLVFGIFEALIALRVGLKIAWAIESVHRLFFPLVHEPVVSVRQTVASDHPIEAHKAEVIREIAGLQAQNHATGPKRFWSGLLFGSLAGAVVILLLAPQTGGKTRANIQQKGMELGGQASEIVEEAIAQARRKTHQITHSVRKQVGDLKQRAQAILDGYKGR
jgi:gas vesicle protein